NSDCVSACAFLSPDFIACPSLRLLVSRLLAARDQTFRFFRLVLLDRPSGRPLEAPDGNHYFAGCAAIAFSICAFTASKLKLAPFCMGGNSIAVWASFATCCC